MTVQTVTLGCRLNFAESETIVVKRGETFKRRYTLPGGAE